MVYRVKEIFYTIQGEGLNAGRPAVFLRFAGCNLWSGREEDRSRGPSCSRWCDTDFRETDGVNGGAYGDAAALARACLAALPDAATGPPLPLLVLTGGEPLLQLDPIFTAELRRLGFELAVETNGTIPVPADLGIHHVCVSPKANAPLRQTWGTELKVVWPQEGLDLDRLERLPFGHLFLQPLDGPGRAENLARCIETVKHRPRWRLSVQTHKLIGIP